MRRMHQPRTQKEIREVLEKTRLPFHVTIKINRRNGLPLATFNLPCGATFARRAMSLGQTARDTRKQ